MKIIKSFFSILLLTSLVKGTGEKELSPKTVRQGLSSNNPFDVIIDDETIKESKELITFLEGEFNPNKKVDPYNLKEPYTAYIIRKIFRVTQNSGKVPDYAPVIFDQLIHPNKGNITQIIAPDNHNHEHNKLVYQAISDSSERMKVKSKK